MTVMLHSIGVYGKGLLVLDAERHRRHRMRLEFRQAEIEIGPTVHNFVMHETGNTRP